MHLIACRLHASKESQRFSIALTMCLITAATAVAQDSLYDPINQPPDARPTTSGISRLPVIGDDTKDTDDTRPPIEALFRTSLVARAAVVADDTRLASEFFLPSAIPVEGQDFFGTGSRTNLQAGGSGVRIEAYSPSTADYQASGTAELLFDNINLADASAFGDANVSVRRLIGRLNRIRLGISDSAFSDPSAVPETLDFAGPSAKITAFDQGVTPGQGRLSYDFFSPTQEGFKVVGSVEQAKPEIRFIGSQPFAKYPDFVCAPQYVEGRYVGTRFEELWHLQFATVFRNLGIENPNADEQNIFGWGTALSGAYRFSVNPTLTAMDRVMFSVAYGDGISHYITDINAANDAGDAVVNGAGVLESLPAFAWYVGYTHYWTDCLRSTVTYSHVDLDSVLGLGATTSPYRSGDYMAVNLLRRYSFFKSEKLQVSDRRNLFVGVEYLFGKKEVLNGAEGEAQRFLFLVAISG
jgi:hypothetical protein